MYFLTLVRTSKRPDQEVPLRTLIDKALNRGYVLLPLAAPHHRREGLVFRWPSDKGKQSRPSPDGGRGNNHDDLSAIASVMRGFRARRGWHI
jgi:hypothetical protein